MGKWSPQPPNRQVLEKKEAAAMPVMVLHREPPWCRLRERRAGGRREGGRQGGVRRGGAGGGGERRGEGSREDGTEGEGARAMEGERGETGRQRGGGGSVGSGGGRGVRPPQLGGGTRARGNSCAAATSAPGPRPHLGAPATNFISLGLLFAVRSTCNLFGASLVMYVAFLIYTHLLITHASSDGNSGSHPSPSRGHLFALATCLGVTLTFTGDPGKVIVCTLLRLNLLLKKRERFRFSGGLY